MILIYPPIAKPSEPPAGIARLSGALKRRGVDHKVMDLNMEAQLWLPESGRGGGASDTWSLRALKHVGRNVSALRDPTTYTNVDRYCRAVQDLNRALEVSVGDSPVTLGLANFRHAELSPVKSRDLIRAAESPEANPFFAFFSDRISTELERGSHEVVGISVNYLSQALTAFSMAGFIKAEYPRMKVVMGGGLITSWLRRPDWRDGVFGGLVDHMVAGPGEERLLSILGHAPSSDIHACPDYSGFGFDKYLSPGGVLPYSGSSGCWWGKCSFCPERAEGNPYSRISAQTAASDLRGMVHAYKPSLVHLLDNSVSPALVRELAESPAGAPWYGFARVSEELGDDDHCAMLRRSGCVMLKLGLESGSEAVLDSMNKGISLHAASRALRALKRAGIATYVYLLFGTPPEAYEDARATLEFAAAHSGSIGFLNLAIFNLPEGAPESHVLKTTGFSDGDLSLYRDFEHPRGWDRRSVRRFLDGEFRKHRAIAPIIRRNPPVFTSNHAAFFV